MLDGTKTVGVHKKFTPTYTWLFDDHEIAAKDGQQSI